MRLRDVALIATLLVACADNEPGRVVIHTSGSLPAGSPRDSSAPGDAPANDVAPSQLALPSEDELDALDVHGLLALAGDPRGVHAMLGRARLLERLEATAELDPAWLPGIEARLIELILDAPERWVRVLERFGPVADDVVVRAATDAQHARQLWRLLVRLSAGPLRGGAVRALAQVVRTTDMSPRPYLVERRFALLDSGLLADVIRVGAFSSTEAEKLVTGFEQDAVAFADAFLQAGFDRAACQVIATADSPAPRYVPVLERMTERGDRETVLSVARALSGVGEAGLPLARRLLRHADADVRAEALRAVAPLGAAAVELWPDALALLAAQPSEDEAYAIGELAERCGRQFDVIQALAPRVEAARPAPTTLWALIPVREAASDWMREAVPALLRSDDPAVRLAAIEVVPGTVERVDFTYSGLLGPSLLDPDPGVRAAARHAISSMSHDASWRPFVVAAIRDLTATRPVSVERLQELSDLLGYSGYVDRDIAIPDDVLRAALDFEDPAVVESLVARAFWHGAIGFDQILERAAGSGAWKRFLVPFLDRRFYAIDAELAAQLTAWLRPSATEPARRFDRDERRQLFELIGMVLDSSERRDFARPFLDDPDPAFRADAIRWTYGPSRAAVEDETPAPSPDDVALLRRRLAVGSEAEVDAVLDVLPDLGIHATPVLPDVVRILPFVPEAAWTLGALSVLGKSSFDAALRAAADRPEEERHRLLDATLEGLRATWRDRKPTPELGAMCHEWLRARYSGPHAWERDEATNWAIRMSGVRR